jgi:hypothetical protein
MRISERPAIRAICVLAERDRGPAGTERDVERPAR